MKVVFFDVDGTLVADFSGVSLVGFLAEKHKFKNENKENLFETAKQYKAGNATYEQFAASWEKEVSLGIKGQSEADVLKLIHAFWHHVEPKFGFWVKDLISLFNNNGFTTIAVSGSQIELLKVYQQRFGFTEVFGTVLHKENGFYTGEMDVNMILSKQKQKIVDSVINRSVSLKDSYGFGDNDHDRAFLDKVGHPIVISSESNLKYHAKSQGWPVFNFSDNVFKEVKILLEKDN